MDDASAIFASPRLTITLEALTRAYDHLVIDGGAMTETPIAYFAAIAPRAVLVAKDIAAPETKDARAQLRRQVSRMWSAFRAGQASPAPNRSQPERGDRLNRSASGKQFRAALADQIP